MRNLRRHTIAASTALALVLSGCSLISDDSADDTERDEDEDDDDRDDEEDRDADEDEDDEADEEDAGEEDAGEEDAGDDASAEVSETVPPASEPVDEPPTTNASDDFANPETPCGIRVTAGEYTPVDCSVPHDAEFAGYVDLASAPLADEVAEEIRIIDACRSTVEELVGLSIADVAIDVEADLFLDDGVAACWTGVLAEETLVGEIGEIGLDAALGDFAMLSTIPAGECFSFVDDDSFDVVLPASCDDLSNAQHAALITLDEQPYPGEGALTDEAFDKCDAALVGVDTIHASYSIVFPSEAGFTAAGQRTVSCVSESFDDDVAVGGIWAIPEAFEFSVDAPVCLVRIPGGEENARDLEQVDCNEAHSTELLAVVDAPFAALPNDLGEATQLMHDLCNPFMEELTGQAREDQGLRVAFQASAGLGELLDGPVACMTTVGDDNFMVGTLVSADIDTVLGDIEILANLAPGTCFIFPGDSFSLGLVVDCAEPGAIMAVGTYTMDDFDVVPPIEEQRAERTRKCTVVYEASGLNGDIDTLSGTFASDESYLYDGERIGTCDITPIL